MRVFTTLADVSCHYPQTTVALGNFDGLHIGHQSVIACAVRIAQQQGIASAVFTFSNHPLSVIAPERCPPQLLTTTDKVRLLRDIGVDILISIPFTSELLRLSPQEFITLIVDTLHPVHIEVGPNYSFGHKGAGTPEMLQAAGEQYGFAVEIHPAVYVDDILVSSTAIRQMLRAGEVDKAAAFMGRPFCLKGRVITGDGRGRTLGFPTANISLKEDLIVPGDGVYAVEIITQQGVYHGVANVGMNPTFHGKNHRLEVFLLDFSADLYGRIITVTFLQKLRQEIKFSSALQLQMQIACDVAQARQIFSS